MCTAHIPGVCKLLFTPEMVCTLWICARIGTVHYCTLNVHSFGARSASLISIWFSTPEPDASVTATCRDFEISCHGDVFCIFEIQRSCVFLVASISFSKSLSGVFCMLSSPIRQLPWAQFLKDRFSLDTEMMVGLVFLDLCRAILNKGGRVGTRNAYLLIDMHLDSHFWVQIQASCCWIPQTQWNAWTFLQRALDAYIPGVCATPLTPVILYEITSELVTVHYCTLNVLIYHFGASSASFNSGFLLQNRMLQ